MWGFPGGPVVKNPPCNARDTDLIPGPEDPTCHRATAHMPQLLSPALQPLKPAHQEPMFHRSHCNEKPVNHHKE